MTEQYCKKTHCHQFFHYDSCHPENMRKSSIYSQGPYFKRLCSDSKNCDSVTYKILKKWFHDKGYHENFIENQLKHVKTKNRVELSRPKEIGSKIVGIPFIVTHRPHLKHLGKLIHNNIKYLEAETKVRSDFTSAPFSSFRTAPNLSKTIF